MSDTSSVELRSSKIVGLDGRTTKARRVRDLALVYAAPLGGMAALSPIDREAVLKGAQLTVAAEDLRRRSLRGEDVDIASLVKLENLASRAVRALNPAHRKPAKPQQTLREYLAARAEGRAA